MLFFIFSQSERSVQSMLDNQPNDQDVEQIKEKMAAVHSQVWLL